jgi:hypothetical protein
MKEPIKKILGLATMLALIVALLPAGGVAFAGKAAPPVLTTLEPGGFRNLEQDLTINVVFVGYEQGVGVLDIDEDAFLGELPGTYRTVNRYPSFYFGNEFLGVDFNFDYNLVYADTTFEDAFFGYLGGIADPEPSTVYQECYNGTSPWNSSDDGGPCWNQVNTTGNVGQNHWVDAPSVEQWLADNTNLMLGVDTSEYTVFFINWYGRADFKFHVYTKTDEPDPDTGYNFGELRDSRKFIAWGGTARR